MNIGLGKLLHTGNCPHVQEARHSWITTLKPNRGKKGHQGMSMENRCCAMARRDMDESLDVDA